MKSIKKMPAHWLYGNVREFKLGPHTYLGDITKENQEGLTAFRLYTKKMVAVNHPIYFKHILMSGEQNFRRGFHLRNAKMLVGTGLVTTNGQEWKERRKMANTAFRPSFLQDTLPDMIACSQTMVEKWEKEYLNKPLPLQSQMQELTLSMIIKMIFSCTISVEENKEFYQTVRECNSLLLNKNTSLIPIPPWFPTKSHRKFDRARRIINQFALNQVKIRREEIKKNPQLRRQDILQVYLDKIDRGEFTQDALLDEIRTLFVAGFETTSLALTWTIYLLARHPNVAEKWQRELDELMSEGEVTWEKVKSLKYTELIIKEGLRLYPSLYSTSRECIKDHVHNGVEFKKGHTYMIAIYGSHRDARYWARATEFIPERFLEEWPRDSYLPFLMGKHTCIGNSMSQIELLTTLTAIGRKFKLSMVKDEEIKSLGRTLLVPEKEIFLKLEKR